MMAAQVTLHNSLSLAASLSQQQQGMVIPKSVDDGGSSSSGGEERKVPKARKKREASNYSDGSIDQERLPVIPSSPQVTHYTTVGYSAHPQLFEQYSYPAHTPVFYNAQAPGSAEATSPLTSLYDASPLNSAPPSPDRRDFGPAIQSRYYAPTVYNQANLPSSPPLQETTSMLSSRVTLPPISELLPSPATRPGAELNGGVDGESYYQSMHEMERVKMEPTVPAFDEYPNSEYHQIPSPAATYYDESYDGENYDGEEGDGSEEPLRFQNVVQGSYPEPNYAYSAHSVNYSLSHYPPNQVEFDYLSQTPKLFPQFPSTNVTRESSERSTNAQQSIQLHYPSPVDACVYSNLPPSYEHYPIQHPKRYEYTPYALGLVRMDENGYQQSAMGKRSREESEFDDRELKRYNYSVQAGRA